ncbi:hypothetical protein ISTM_363 [Insectomime virus]|uniref:Uncharacterized protein n=1 Tax=Tunisvirus fontaine2 TaxID=1421067 RepID=V9SEK5_9VIRU|nr:hypothetical protein D1R32_gp438 [Tunisvirus fontaine2]AHA46261.1 hypothetical protein ISTM_363 [Insectomime virus]AHC55155.1 hypothetical protein TNS_ORF437 [Tunisvirus fontaine2]
MLFWETDEKATEYELLNHSEFFAGHLEGAHPIIKRLVLLGKLRRTRHDPMPWKTLEAFYGTEYDIQAEFNVNFTEARGFSFSWRHRDKTGIRESFADKNPELVVSNIMRVCEWYESHSLSVYEYRQWAEFLQRKYFKKYFLFSAFCSLR